MSEQVQNGSQKPGAVTAMGVLSIIFGSLAIIAQGIVGMVTAFAARVSSGSFLNELQTAVGEESDEAAEAMGEMANAFQSAAGVSAQMLFLTGLIFSILALIVAVLQLSSGIALLKGGQSAIKLNAIYAYSAIGVTVIRVVLYIIIGRPVAWFWSVFGLVYPILIIALVVNSATVKEWHAKQNPGTAYA